MSCFSRVKFYSKKNTVGVNFSHLKKKTYFFYQSLEAILILVYYRSELQGKVSVSDKS